MILDINIKVSVRCSECGEKLSAVMSLKSENDYDSIMEVEPHTCSQLTQRAVDGACTCGKNTLTHTLMNGRVICDVCGKPPRR
jgi:formylmethanofuran dehydrogenase subunit E